MPELEPFGESAVLVRFTSPSEAGGVKDTSSWARAFAERVRAARLPEVSEVSAGSRSALIELRDVPSQALQLLASTAAVSESAGPESRLVEIPARYDGQDLHDVAARIGFSVEAVVKLHSEATYTVAFIGFSPGFPYLLGTPEPLRSIGRRDNPRAKVPAGSIGIASGWSAIYPSGTPGGWNLIATTDTPMFDANSSPPAALQPGDHVRFRIS